MPSFDYSARAPGDGIWEPRPGADAAIEAPDLHWDVVGLPARREQANLAGGAAYTIAAGRSHKEAAWALVRFLEGPRGQALFNESGLIVPARRSIREDNIFLRQTNYDSQVFADETDRGRPNLNSPLSTDARRSATPRCCRSGAARSALRRPSTNLVPGAAAAAGALRCACRSPRASSAASRPESSSPLA